jgi:hypothetical protein
MADYKRTSINGESITPSIVHYLDRRGFAQTSEFDALLLTVQEMERETSISGLESKLGVRQ